MLTRLMSLAVVGSMVAALAISVGAAGSAASVHAPRYTMSPLGTLGGDTAFGRAGGIGLDLNDSGVVVGASYVPDTLATPHATLFRKGGTVDLDAGDGSGTWATQASAVNARGDVIGYLSTGSSFLYRDGGVNPLPTLGGTGTNAIAINNAGEVVGASITASDQLHAFVYDRSGELVDLAPLVGDTSWGTGINNRGEIVGYRAAGYGTATGFRYSHGAVTDLGDFEPWALNDNGLIVGRLHFFHGSPAVYRDGAVQDLGLLPGWTNGAATDVNENGTIVGMFAERPSQAASFLYTDGRYYYLNDVVPERGSWSFKTANPVKINNRGQIVAEALNTTTGQLCGFLLTRTAG